MEILDALRQVKDDEELSSFITKMFDDIETSIGDCRNDLFGHRYLAVLGKLYEIIGIDDKVNKDFNNLALLETKLELECYKKMRKCMIKSDMLDFEVLTSLIYIFSTITAGREKRAKHISGTYTENSLGSKGISFYAIETINNYDSYIPHEEKDLKESLATVINYTKKPLANKTGIDK